jgi:post-segregation antitoxin (ccd killing protein)
MGATKDVIEKVAKLLALASGRGTTPEEAATAAAAAQRLMLRHRIEQAEVERLEADDPIGLTSPPAGAGEGREEGFVYQTQRWQLDLLKAIAAANGCMVVITRKERSGKWMELVGRQSDLEISRYLWAYLSREILRLKTQQTRGWSRGRKNHFCLGAVHTVAAALRRETAAASSADGLTSGAMVVSSRFEAAKAWYFERQPGAHFVRPRPVYVDVESYQAGKTAGAGVSIRQGMSTTIDPRRLLT